MLACRRSLQPQFITPSLFSSQATHSYRIRTRHNTHRQGQRRRQQLLLPLPPPQLYGHQHREMATEAKKKYEWLVILPDYPGALSKRMAVRPEHLENAKKLGSSRLLALGGATLDEQPVPGQPVKINGSVLLAIAESKEEVEELIKADVYARSNVWDMSKVQIYPFVSAIRNAM